MRMKAMNVFFILLLAIDLTIPAMSYAMALITPEEAALPPMKGAVANSKRGIMRGPKIMVPENADDVMSSPIRLQVKFQGMGGSTIDLEGLKVTYLKQPNVDLTPRVRPFVQQTGIDIPDALVPSGEHLLRIDVRDSEGRTSTMSFLLKIAP